MFSTRTRTKFWSCGTSTWCRRSVSPLGPFLLPFEASASSLQSNGCPKANRGFRVSISSCNMSLRRSWQKPRENDKMTNCFWLTLLDLSGKLINASMSRKTWCLSRLWDIFPSLFVRLDLLAKGPGKNMKEPNVEQSKKASPRLWTWCKGLRKLSDLAA